MSENVALELMVGSLAACLVSTRNIHTPFKPSLANFS